MDSTDNVSIVTARSNVNSPFNSCFEEIDFTARVPLDDKPAIIYCPVELSGMVTVSNNRHNKVVPVM